MRAAADAPGLAWPPHDPRAEARGHRYVLQLKPAIVGVENTLEGAAKVAMVALPSILGLYHACDARADEARAAEEAELKAEAAAAGGESAGSSLKSPKHKGLLHTMKRLFSQK